MWCRVERTGSSFACASAAACRVYRHCRAIAHDPARADRISGSRRVACASARCGEALATASDRVSVWHHPRRDVQPAEADRHHDPASADLRTRQFRSGGHNGLDRQATARRRKLRLFSFRRPIARPRATLWSQGRASRCRRSLRLWQSRPHRKPMPRPRSRKTKPKLVSIHTRNTSLSRLRMNVHTRRMSICLTRTFLRPTSRRPAQDRVRSRMQRVFISVLTRWQSAKESISPWAPGEAPVVLASRGDPDIKESALRPAVA